MSATGNFQVHSRAAMKKTARQGRRTQHPVVIEMPSKDLAQEALKRAHGNRERIQFLSRSRAIIWNSPEQKRAMQGKVS